MSSDDDKLNEVMAYSPASTCAPINQQPQAVEDKVIGKSSAALMDYCQWSSGPNETFRPSGPRRETLPTGVYNVAADEMGPFFAKAKIVTDNLIEFEDAATVRVLSSIRKFWRSRNEYVKRGVLYKRGLLLWGPAGGGKTATLTLLMRELLSLDGLVFICQNPGILSQMLAVLRRIEPERNVIVVMEDIDELVGRHGEHDILALLDGENQVNNVVSIATTNYPEKLGSRIVNRPSRFDERIFVDMPNDKSREKYLRHITKHERLADEMLYLWVQRTSGFSVAHLRELVVAVFCLDQPFEEVIERLKKMQYQPKPMKEFVRNDIGMAQQSGFAASMPSSAARTAGYGK